MQRPERPTLQIQSGEATTEYNMNQLTTFRINDSLIRCGQFKKFWTIEGFNAWIQEVIDLDNTLVGLLTTAEEAELAKFRVGSIPHNANGTNGFFQHQFKKINQYERKVRYYLQLKGLGVTAKAEDDPSKAMLR